MTNSDSSNPVRLVRRGLLLGAAAASLAPLTGRHARAQSTAAPLKIGVLGDFSGPYSGISGIGSVTAAGFAIADVGGKVLGRPVEVVTADHQNKADVGLGVVREWFGPSNVSLVIDVANSGIALGMQPLLSQFHRIALYTTVGNPLLMGSACSPLSVVWALDTWASTVVPVRALLKQGKTSFFLIAADYVFGKTLETDAAAAIAAGGGTVRGTVRHPLGASDFSSYLLLAQASGAEVVMLLNGGQDFVSSFKQAAEFRIPQKQAVVAPVVFLSDVHALGLELAQGLQFAAAWYWDQSDATRAWAKRYFAERGSMPNDTHAAAYSAVLQYLRAVERAGSDDPERVMATLRAATIDDVFVSGGHIRADGKLMFDRYLVRAKRPQDSHGPWDLLEVASTVAAQDAARPLAESACPLVHS